MSQLDQLTEVLGAISSDVDQTLGKVTQLEADLKAAQESTPPEVDLTPLIEQASAIRARLEGVSTAVTDAGTGGSGDAGDTGEQPSTGDTGAGDTGAGDTGAGDTGAGDTGAGEESVRDDTFPDDGSVGEDTPLPEDDGTQFPVEDTGEEA
jgi:hypothetical protein